MVQEGMKQYTCIYFKGKENLGEECIGDERSAELIKIGYKLRKLMMIKDCASVLKGTAILNI